MTSPGHTQVVSLTAVAGAFTRHRWTPTTAPPRPRRGTHARTHRSSLCRPRRRCHDLRTPGARNLLHSCRLHPMTPVQGGPEASRSPVQHRRVAASPNGSCTHNRQPFGLTADTAAKCLLLPACRNICPRWPHDGRSLPAAADTPSSRFAAGHWPRRCRPDEDCNDVGHARPCRTGRRGRAWRAAGGRITARAATRTWHAGPAGRGGPSAPHEDV